MAKTKVILDVDTGSDDAVAIMAALLSDDLEVVACCTVWGNKDLSKTTENTLRVLEAMGRTDIPVYAGMDTALVKYIYPNRIPLPERKPLIVDGKQIQMHEDYLDLPTTSKKAEDMHAVTFYINYLRAAKEKITLIPVGPLSNLGAALSIAPDIADHLEQIVIMGGGNEVANITSQAEANIWHDPEAAEIVTNAKTRVLWVPLDATHEACLTLDDCKRFRALNTFAGNFAAELTEQRIAVHNLTQPLAVPDAAAVHDALAVCAVIDESVLTKVEHVRLDVGFQDVGEGRTIIDRRVKPDPKNCYFAHGGDRKKFADMLCGLFAKSAAR